MFSENRFKGVVNSARKVTLTLMVLMLFICMGSTAMAAEDDDYASRYGSVKGDVVNVRPDAGSKDGPVTKLNNGEQVVIVGEKNAPDGQLWYKITVNVGGTETSGYVRNDLITPGDYVSPPEEAQDNPEESNDIPVVDTAPELNDYKVWYETLADGTNEWYLDDNTVGVRYKMAEIMELTKQDINEASKANGKLKKLQLLCVLLAVFVAVCFVVITMLWLRIRSLNEEMEEGSAYNRREGVRKPQTRPTGTGAPRSQVRSSSQRPAGAPRLAQGGAGAVRTAPQRKRDDEPMPRRRPEGQAPARKTVKAKNFMAEDDDFEYNFLDD